MRSAKGTSKGANRPCENMSAGVSTCSKSASRGMSVPRRDTTSGRTRPKKGASADGSTCRKGVSISKTGYRTDASRDTITSMTDERIGVSMRRIGMSVNMTLFGKARAEKR